MDMAEQHEESSGLIKTPKQLIVVVVIALFLPVAVAVFFSQLVTSGRSGGDLSEEAVARRIQPMAKVELAGAAAAPVAAAGLAPAGGSANGKKVYDASCAACHGAGVAGAPKLGDKAAWAPRLKAGMDVLMTGALKGKGAMPPKGGNAGIADADIRTAVEYMAAAAK
jgi:cytochrome c5